MTALMPGRRDRPARRALAGLLLAGSMLAPAGCLPAGGVREPSPIDSRADSIARESIARERLIDPASIDARTVGVAPFTVQTFDTSLAVLGWGLADILTTDLARSRSLRVVERLHIDALLRELGLAESGRVDTATAPRIGRLAGARQIVSGLVVQLPDSALRLSTRVADVAQGAVRSAESSALSADRILESSKSLAFSVFERLGVTLTPAERAQIEQRPTANLAALLAYSRGVRDEALGRPERAAAAYRDAIRLDPAFTPVRAKLEALTGRLERIQAASPGAQLRRASGLAMESVHPGGLAIASPASDPSFRASTEQLVLFIIQVTIR